MKSSTNQQGFTLKELLIAIFFVMLPLIGHGFNIYLLQQAYTSEIWIEVAIRMVAFIVFPIGWIMGFVPL